MRTTILIGVLLLSHHSTLFAQGTELSDLQLRALRAETIRLLPSDNEDSLKVALRNEKVLLKHFEAIERERAVAATLLNLGAVLAKLQQFENARANVRRADALYLALGFDYGRGAAATIRGDIAKMEGDTSVAINAYCQATEFLSSSSDGVRRSILEEKLESVDGECEPHVPRSRE